jgi:single-strand DNA-binding protein
MLNRVTLIGRLGKDVELRYLNSGTPVANFSMACETSYKKGEKWEKVVYWGDIIIFGGRAEAAAEHLSKGSIVYVEGRLQKREWEKEGRKQNKTEVVADRVIFLDNKGGGKTAPTGEEDYPPEETQPEPF